MGRGNYCARGNYAGQWYLDYDNYYSPMYDAETDEETEETFFDQDLLDEDVSMLMQEIEDRFPSFRHCDKWGNYYEGRENHFLLENEMFYIGIADNEWSASIFIQGKDEDISWHGYEGLAGKHFDNYTKQIEKILLDMFGDVYKRNGAWMSSKIERSA